MARGDRHETAVPHLRRRLVIPALALLQRHRVGGGRHRRTPRSARAAYLEASPLGARAPEDGAAPRRPPGWPGSCAAASSRDEPSCGGCHTGTELGVPKLLRSPWWCPTRPLFVQEHDSSSSLTQLAQLGAQRGPLTDELGNHVVRSGAVTSARVRRPIAPRRVASSMGRPGSPLAIGHPRGGIS